MLGDYHMPGEESVSAATTWAPINHHEAAAARGCRRSVENQTLSATIASISENHDMPGQIHELITKLIRLRVGDNRHLEAPFKIKLIMQGIDPDLFDKNSPDDPVVIQRVRSIANTLGYTL